MTLAAGARLGPYEIISPLGAGGMGEVYRAHDTKLGRDVALKVLPDSFARGPDQLERFAREAHLLAALNHPSIAHLYGFEDSTGVPALVMELVEGPTLAEHIARGPMPIEEALHVARQIAQAIEAAHDRGIIHRDLKPANIKLRPDGTVKVLDFGLAKAFETSPFAANVAESSTVLSPAPTLPGVILGTAAYMSPEQARGKAVDKRADVWAFGCVLFEMLAGRRPFAGETMTDMLAAVVKSEPDWKALPAGTPATVQSVIARCLKKDPAQRLRDIADARLQLEEVPDASPEEARVTSPTRNYRQWAGWIAAALLLSAAVFLAVRLPANSPSGDLMAFPVFPPDKTAFSEAVNTTLSIPSFALAPDGHAIVFSAREPGGKAMLWVREMDRIAPRMLQDTDNAESPFWSPDSLRIGFAADGNLKWVLAKGGPVLPITQTSGDFRGGTWGPGDTILFGASRGPILSVNAAIGKTTTVTAIDLARQEGSHRSPQFLPDGRHFLYSILGTNPEVSGVYVGSLDGKIKMRLVDVPTSAVYAPPGHLLFVDGDRLLGQVFDAERFVVTGPPFLVAEHVGRNTGFMSAVSASRTGAIAYAGTLSQNGRLTWMDRATGYEYPLPSLSPGDYVDFRLSPDGNHLAASLVDPKANVVQISLINLLNGTNETLPSGGLVSSAVQWSLPGGERLAFRSNRSGQAELYQMSAAGGGIPQPLLSSADSREMPIPQNLLVPSDWSSKGDLMCSVPAPGSGYDLYVLPVTIAGNAKLAKFVESRNDQMHGNFSPDGHLVAYTSNENDRFQIYVETFPKSQWKQPVSTNGGYEPRWSADGRELYYLSEDRKLMVVSVGAGPTPTFGPPRPLFQTRVAAGVTTLRTHYVPSRDGKRFLVNVATDTAASPITVELNWAAALKK
jgi:serine/threonine protein kinase